DEPSGDPAMRRSGSILFVCLLAGCGANPATDEASREGGNAAADGAADASAWQGTWKLVSCVADGESQIADLQWVVDGDHYPIRLEEKAGTDPYPFTLDPEQKRIEVNHHETPEGTYGGRLRGIYEVRGDSLKVCYDLKGQQYPESFDAPRGSKRVLYQFQR